MDNYPSEFTADALSRFDNLDFTATAHALLEQRCGIDIAHAQYDLLKHTSQVAFIHVLQGCNKTMV